MPTDDLAVHTLQAGDAPELARMLRSQSPEYARFFYPFSFDEGRINEMLAKCEQDVYLGLYREGRMVGFFMLRGWDEGYEVPAFGILIDENYRGFGLEMLALETAKVICRLRGATRMMLKMHPDNFTARGVARKIGFHRSGVEEKTGNVIYHMELEGLAPRE